MTPIWSETRREDQRILVVRSLSILNIYFNEPRFNPKIRTYLLLRPIAKGGTLGKVRDIWSVNDRVMPRH